MTITQPQLILATVGAALLGLALLAVLFRHARRRRRAERAVERRVRRLVSQALGETRL